MMSRMKAKTVRVLSCGWSFCMMLGLLLLPLVALAQDEHDTPIPLDPETKRTQLWIFGLIGMAFVLFLVWYWLRRWQISQGPKVTSTEQDQD